MTSTEHALTGACPSRELGSALHGSPSCQRPPSVLAVVVLQCYRLSPLMSDICGRSHKCTSILLVQERGLRSGTLPAPLAVGFGAAAEVAARDMVSDAAHIKVCRL